MARSFLLLAWLGCAAPPAEMKPPLTLPDSGAAIYLIESDPGWLDDFSKIEVRKPGDRDACRFGEQAFAIVLRIADRGRNARLLRTDQFELKEGVAVERVLENYTLTVMPLPSDVENHLTVQYSLRRGETMVTSGRETMPFRAALEFVGSEETARNTLLFLRIASLEK